MQDNKPQAKQGEQEVKVEQPKRSLKIKTSIKAGSSAGSVCD
jgi:hypothetical protein